MACAVLQQLRDRLSEVGLAHIKIVGFDQAHVMPDYLRFLSGRPGNATLLDVAGLHCYRDDVDYAPVLELLPKIGEPALWLTEYGDLDNTGEHELDVAISLARRLVRAMNMGVTAALAWDAYDNWHRHENGWTIYGLLRTAVRVPTYSYSKKRRYFAARHFYRYIRPGWWRASCSEQDLMPICAFVGDTGELSAVGVNLLPEERTFVVTTDSPHPQGPLALLVTSMDLSCEVCYRSSSSGSGPALTVPGRSIFTVTTLAA